MNVKQAVGVARKYVEELFAEEQIMNVGLEEIDAEEEGFWKITIGFSRPWNANFSNLLSGDKTRIYKVVLVRDSDGEILSVKNRVFTAE